MGRIGIDSSHLDSSDTFDFRVDRFWFGSPFLFFGGNIQKKLGLFQDWWQFKGTA